MSLQAMHADALGVHLIPGVLRPASTVMHSLLTLAVDALDVHPWHGTADGPCPTCSARVSMSLAVAPIVHSADHDRAVHASYVGIDASEHSGELPLTSKSDARRIADALDAGTLRRVPVGLPTQAQECPDGTARIHRDASPDARRMPRTPDDMARLSRQAWRVIRDLEAEQGMPVTAREQVHADVVQVAALTLARYRARHAWTHDTDTRRYWKGAVTVPVRYARPHGRSCADDCTDAHGTVSALTLYRWSARDALRQVIRESRATRESDPLTLARMARRDALIGTRHGQGAVTRLDALTAQESILRTNESGELADTREYVLDASARAVSYATEIHEYVGTRRGGTPSDLLTHASVSECASDTFACIWTDDAYPALHALVACNGAVTRAQVMRDGQAGTVKRREAFMRDARAEYATFAGELEALRAAVGTYAPE